MRTICDLVIVTNEPFPVGMAATNRIISYAKEIAKQKEVCVLIPQPTEHFKNTNNKHVKGQVDLLKYEYTNTTTIWPSDKTKFQKLLVIIIGIINLIKRLFQLRPKTIIIYTSRYHIRLILKGLKPFLKFLLIVEENEYPKILSRTKNKKKQNNQLRFYSSCDGMMVMTNELKSYYNGIGVKEVFHLPMTVDFDRFKEKRVEKDFAFDYFIYVGGSGGFQRDGVINLIESFIIFHQEYPDVKLVIIGPVNYQSLEYIKIKELIQKENVNDSVLFLGSKPSDEIPNYLYNAKGVVMTPQENFPSGGFPTKLGEFLVSQRPVVTTNVSEISRYLNDKNSFIVPPGDNTLVAAAMKKIMQEQHFADLIAATGLKTALKEFNVKKYVADLIIFLKI